MIFTLKLPTLTGGTIKAMFCMWTYSQICNSWTILNQKSLLNVWVEVNQIKRCQYCKSMLKTVSLFWLFPLKKEFRMQYFFFEMPLSYFSSIKHFSQTIKWLNSNYAMWTFINSILKPLVTSFKQELNSSNAVTQCQKWESCGTTASLAIASY